MNKLKSLLQKLKKNFDKRKRVFIGGTMVIILLLAGIFAPIIAPYHPYEQNFDSILQPPSSNHLFGTDQFGRDMFSRVIHGIRISLLEIFFSISLSILIGVPFGIIAGYIGGNVDQLIMWAFDIIFAFPGIILAILIVSVLGPSLINMLIAISIFSVPIFGRLSRNITLSLKEQEFVIAAKALGASNFRIMTKHILKNSLAPLIVQATLTAGGVILTASSLSFLGLGVQPPSPEWGRLIGTGRNFIGVATYMSLFPGMAITYTVLAFNILGDGLRDYLDPKIKG